MSPCGITVNVSLSGVVMVTHERWIAKDKKKRCMQFLGFFFHLCFAGCHFCLWLLNAWCTCVCKIWCYLAHPDSYWQTATFQWSNVCQVENKPDSCWQNSNISVKHSLLNWKKNSRTFVNKQHFSEACSVKLNYFPFQAHKLRDSVTSIVV